jgi:hypothetical protein
MAQMIAVLREREEQLRARGEGDQGDPIAAVLLKRVGQMAQGAAGKLPAAGLFRVHAATQVQNDDNVAPHAMLGAFVETPLRTGARQRRQGDARQEAKPFPAACAHAHEHALAQLQATAQTRRHLLAPEIREEKERRADGDREQRQ